MTKYPSISLFSGAFGLDLGLEKAGFDVRALVEKDPVCVETIIANRPHLAKNIINKDINHVSVKEILKVANLKRGKAFLVAGGPPCQPFSTVGKRKSISSEEGMLFKKFLDVVWGIYPQYFIFENVKGIVSSAIRHVPLKKRNKTKINKNSNLGSAWDFIRKEFSNKLKEGKRNGYKIHVFELDSSDFGVPQKRKRVFIIGVRSPYKTKILQIIPNNQKVTVKDTILELCGKDEKEGIDYRSYDATRFKIFSNGLVKDGQNWTVLPTRLQKKVMGKGWYATGGKVGFCRRLAWDKPSPTITTDPAGRATNMCHPSRPRPLTYQECALLQGFPENWKFAGSLTHKYRQIGNAVPVQLANKIGTVLIQSLRSQR